MKYDETLFQRYKGLQPEAKTTLYKKVVSMLAMPSTRYWDLVIMGDSPWVTKRMRAYETAGEATKHMDSSIRKYMIYNIIYVFARMFP